MSDREGEVYFEEQPEGEIHLQQRLEGLQIARLDYVNDDLPVGWSGAALSFTSFERMVIVTMPVSPGSCPYESRLMFRWMERPDIVTGSLAKAYRRERGRAGMYHIVGEDSPPDHIQQQIEGSVISGWSQVREPNKHGGEWAKLELRDGRTIEWHSMMERDKHGRRTPWSLLILQITQGQAPPLIVPGTGAVWRELENVRKRSGK